MKHLFLKLQVGFLILFGVLTLFMSSAVLFDWFGIRAKEGNFVPFVVWANWVCGFLYCASAYGLLNKKRWATILLIVALLLLVITFIALLIHINNGGIYELKTKYAMLFRTSITAALTVSSYFLISKK